MMRITLAKNRLIAMAALAVMAGNAGTGLYAETSPAPKVKASARGNRLNAGLTLAEATQAFAAADAQSFHETHADVQKLKTLMTTAPDALCAPIAELALQLRKANLWRPLGPMAFFQWAMIDAPAAAHRMDTIADAERKAEAWASLVQAWRQRDPETCWRYLLALPEGKQRDHDIERFLEEMSIKEPQRVLEKADQLTNLKLRDRVRDEVAWRWAEKDTPAALAWVNTILDSVERDRLLRRVVLGVTSHNKQGGLAQALALTDAKLRFEMVNEVHSVWSNADVVAAIGSFVRLPADLQDVRKTVAHFGFASVKLDRKTVLLVADELKPLDGARDLYLQRCADRHTRESHVHEALALLDHVPPSKERSEGMRQVALNWATMSAEQAIAWVKSLPPSAERDQASEGIAWGLMQTSPEQAQIQAEQLISSNTQLRANLYAAWSKKDSSAARRWLEANDKLAAKDKEEYLRQAKFNLLVTFPNH